jgi:pimeloyl-ACP methyl ester carboxylesterase
LGRELDGSYTLIAPDLAGFGRSDKPLLRYHRTFHLETIDEVVAWGGGRPVLVGHSVGAVLAGLWAARHPEEVDGLAVVAAIFPRPGLMPLAALRLAKAQPESRGRMADGVLRAIWPAVSVGARLTHRYPAGLVSDFGRQSIGARADTMWTTLSDLTVVDELAPLASLSPRWPSLIAAAADDRYLRPSDLTQWQRLLPHAEEVILPTGGHQFLLKSGFAPLRTWLSKL